MATVGSRLARAAAAAALATAVTGCGTPGPQQMQPLSKAALGNPSCLYRCTVTITTVDDNKTDSLAPTLSGSRTETTTSSTTLGN